MGESNLLGKSDEMPDEMDDEYGGEQKLEDLANKYLMKSPAAIAMKRKSQNQPVPNEPTLKLQN